MNALIVFLGLDLLLVSGAALLLLVVIVRRGRSPQYIALAGLLIVLAVGVWYTAIRTPPVLP